MTTTLARAVALATVLLLAIATTGCFTFRAAMPGAVRADVDERELEDVGALDEAFTHIYFVHGAIGAPADDILRERILKAAEEAGADGIRDLELEARFTWTGIAVTLATLSLVHPRRYRVTGTLVRIAAPALPSGGDGPSRESAPEP